MRNFPDCEEYKNDQEIVLKENQSKVTFLNPKSKKIRVIRIDGCVITSGLRCDYAIVPNSSIEIYVELKGSDIRHAVEQLKSTISQVSENTQRKSKLCLIISTRCPVLSAEIQNLKRHFKDKYNASFQIKNKIGSCDLSKL
jgi:hypothetical protein